MVPSERVGGSGHPSPPRSAKTVHSRAWLRGDALIGLGGRFGPNRCFPGWGGVESIRAVSTASRRRGPRAGAIRGGTVRSPRAGDGTTGAPVAAGAAQAVPAARGGTSGAKTP